MKTKIVLIALSIFLILSSCATQKRCTAKFPMQNSRDSVYIETVEKVPVYIPGDSILVNVPVNCPDQEIATIENATLKQTIKILKGRLISETQIKPDTVMIFKTNTITITKEVKTPPPVRYVPKFYKFCLGWGIMTWVLIVAYLGFKIRNLIIKI
jgi:hypothetical protein